MHHLRAFPILVLLAVLLSVTALSLAATPVSADPGVIYVDQAAAGADNGASWTHAYTDLQRALAAAQAGDEIWVAAGVYRPTAGLARTATFALRNDVALYGGFAGTETARDQRDWVTRVVTLSGDIGLTGVVTDNVYHVVTSSNTGDATVLDGFHIAGGYADGSWPHSDGAGLHNYRGRPTLRHLVFAGNHAAAYGGGLYSEGYLVSSPTLTDVTFTGNSSSSGGGMFIENSSATLRHVAFTGNSSGSGGGFKATSSVVTLSDGVFSGNSAGAWGGGMSHGGGSLTLVNVTFAGNSATHTAGGLYLQDCSPSLTNVVFRGNSASQGGGGIYNLRSYPTLTHATFYGNTSVYGSGGLHTMDGQPTVRNSIFWGNTPTALATNALTPTVEYSDIQGTGVYSGTGNINADPQFVDAAGGNLRLKGVSPAVDAGSNALTPADAADLDGDGNTAEPLPYDLAGGARFVDMPTADTGSGTAPLVDMGAYEAGVLYVDADATGANNGTSWADAFTDLQTALITATAGVEIWVAEGVYVPGGNRDADFALKNNVALYGGFVGTETLRTERDWTAHVTTLSGATGLGNAYHVVTAIAVDRTALLDGFTITNGQADGAAVTGDDSGGGIYIDSSGWPTLRHLIFTGNTATYGGGLYNGMYSNPLLVNVAFRGNSAAAAGGGIANGNTGVIQMVNGVFYGNSSSGNGGAVSNASGAEALFTHVSFANNSATGSGGAVYNDTNSTTFRNAILWGNTPDQVYSSNASVSVEYSDIEGGCPADVYCTHIITGTPQFADAAAGNLRLQKTSPAVDAGNNAFTPTDASDLDGDGNTSEPLPFDLDGAARFVDAPVGDTGAGAAPIVDMGAYEAGVSRLYVDKDATGANNGSSWADAFTDLQAALAVAVNDEIWVAEGVYLPTTGADRSAAFALKNDVALYGGFAGTETNRDQRDWAAHVTTLSGDIGATGIVTDNVYHVVKANPVADAVLDGFTISGGYADGANGTGDNYGGGMNNYEAQVTLRNVTLADNYAVSAGGGIMNGGDCNLRLVNATFVGNTSQSGGGMASIYHSRLDLVNVLFRNNTATGNGGGMLNGTNVTVTLTNVAFFSNTALLGGGMENQYNHATLVNVTFAYNTATNQGGGIRNRPVNLTLRNAIFWGNTPEPMHNYQSTVAITHSDIQGGCPTGAMCSNVLDGDPQFVDAANGDLHLRLSSPALDAGDNTAVLSDTLDLDGDGNTAEALPYDLDSSYRFYDVAAPDTGNGVAPIVDMGAYESTRHPLYVDRDAAGANDGSSWADAFTEVQSALAIATAGDEIWVAEGVYLPTTDADRSASFVLKDNVAIYGGFAGSETGHDQRDWAGQVTTLSGDIGVTGIVTDNVYHVVKGTDLTRTAILDGFTISGGYADGPNGGNDGGGMHTIRSSVTVRNVTLTGNYAADFGAGMYNSSGSPLLVSAAFVGNTGPFFGGGMYNVGNGRPEIVNSMFSDNSAQYGGGMCNHAITSTLTNVVFYNNHASDRGGGMNNVTSAPTMVNVTFYGNSADYGGGGIHNESSSHPIISNTLVWGNTALTGTQIYNLLNSAPTIATSAIEGGCPAGAVCASGVISSNPQFVDAPGGNLRLSIASPAVDAGDNTVVPADAFDLDGDGDTAEALPYDLGGGPRFVDIPGRLDTGNGTAPLVDMGAYETQDAPDVMVVKTASAANATPGQAITYTLNFANAGGVTATQVVITDLVPSGLTDLAGQWTLPGGQITRTAGITYVWSLSDLAPGQSGVITLTGVVAASAVDGEIVNTAHITCTDDANGGNDSSAVSIVLNGPPAAAADSYPATEDTPLSVPAPGVLDNDSDPNGDALTAALVTAPTRGTLTFHADGAFIYTPTENLNGVDTFTYRAGDGALWSDPAVVTITVAPVNDPPVAEDDTSNVAMNTPRVISVLGNDTDLDGDPLTIAAVSAPSHGAATSLGATILYTPNVGYLGEDSFSYTIADTGGLTDTATVAILVGSVNQPPVAVDDAVTTTQNTPVTIAVLSNDLNPDLDTLFVAGVSAPAHGSAAIQGATVVYTPALDYVGLDTFTYIASDGEFTSTAGVSVTIYDVTPPDVLIVKTASTANAAPGQTVTYTLNFSSMGGVTATHVVITDLVPSSLVQVSGQWTLPGGQITRTAGITYAWSVSDLAPGQGGVITLTGVVAASAVAGEIVNTAHITCMDDANGGNDSSAVSIVLNGPPVAVADSYPATEDTPLSVLMPGVLGNDVDPNSHVLQAALVTTPTRGALTFRANGSFIYTPTENLNGVDTFTYRASDGALWSDPAVVTITVAPVNDPPVAGDDTSNVAMNTPRVISVLGNDSDLDGDPLTIAAVSAPSHGAATSLGATILYTPNVGYLGEDSFSYTIADSGGLTDTATVAILVGSVNQPPVAVDDAVTTPQNTPVTIAVLSNDLNPDLDTLFVAGVSTPAHGSAAIQGATVVYTPALDYVGLDTFTYIASDGEFTSTAGVSVTIYDVTPPQVVAVSPLNGATGVTVTASIVITFSEAINATAFAYTVSPDPGGWAAVWNGAGTQVTLSHAPFAYNTVYTVTVTAAPDLAGNPLENAPYRWAFTTMEQPGNNYVIYLPLVGRNF